MTLHLRQPDWRDHRTVSVADAAIIFDRSTTWVLNRITDRRLCAAEQRPIAITTESVAALLRSLTAQRRVVAKRPMLRLVWDASRPELFAQQD